MRDRTFDFHRLKILPEGRAWERLGIDTIGDEPGELQHQRRVGSGADRAKRLEAHEEVVSDPA